MHRGTGFRVKPKEEKKKEPRFETVHDARKLIAAHENAPEDVKSEVYERVREKFPDLLIERRRV